MKKEILSNFKNKLMVNKETVYGTWAQSTDPALTECVGHAGFDFIILDMEHGTGSLDNMQNLVRAAENVNLFPIIRVKDNSTTLISEALEIGALGVQIPQIRNAKDVERVIEYSKYQPMGMRGICPFTRAADYSAMDKYEYFNLGNETMVILQLEGNEAIENIDKILEVKGYDIIFIGPYDLSHSLGIVGQIDDPLVFKKGNEIIEKCNKKGIMVGIFSDNLDNVKKWMAQGAKFVTYMVDLPIFYNACKDNLKKIKMS
jgi:4-hydroxy-2-oxoheptanedioate aldolase